MPIKYESEAPDLLEREINNYNKINHPHIPKFYGTIKETVFLPNGKKDFIFYPIIEFINGKSLLNIKQFHFTENEKITIISELIITIYYLHEKKFVLRDLKPNNIIIDENKKVFIIDFDRMISYEDNSNIMEHTQDFCTEFVAPEVNRSIISNKNDIFSLGQMIYYIINERYPKTQKIENNKSFENNLIFRQIYYMCTNNDLESRPSILELIYIFCISFKTQMKLLINENDPNLQILYNFFFCKDGLQKISIEYSSIKKLETMTHHFYSSILKSLEGQLAIGTLYFLGEDIPQDIDNPIYYLKLAADQNNPEAQYFLSIIYQNEKYATQDINKSIHYLELAANQNHPQAQYDLGNIYLQGKYVIKNINKAIKYFSSAANQNYAPAQFILGIIYIQGLNIKQDLTRAFHYLTLASNQNHRESQYVLGQIYYIGKDIKQDINKAIYYFTLAANQNHATAQNKLGKFYESGEYIQRDIKKAFYYYTQAANQNYPEAQYNLGVMYESGEYVQRDIKKAIYYFQFASNQNFPEAQNKLGQIYYIGEYISRDVTKAIYYFTQAANQNHPEAQYNLGVIYNSGEYVQRDNKKSFYYFTQAANQNYPEAQYNLGVMYESGVYVQRDITKAIYYFQLVANLNYPEAQFNLGYIYESGIYVTRDIYRAIHYFQLAVNLNYQEAQIELGIIYSSGKYIKRDINKAIHYFQLAANQNNPKAQYNLGVIYNSGEYVQRDVKKAFYCFTQAANQNYPKAQYNLGIMYESGEYVQRDRKKAIYFFQLAANQNHPMAQYYLGIFHIAGINIEQNIKKGIYLLLLSANKYKDAYFTLGYIYHGSGYVETDINKAIHFYKEASSFNNQYAKNNLGIIYKNGFGKEISQQIGRAVDYFEENINQKKDKVSMYNLAHIFLYDLKIEEKVNKSIEYLIESLKQDFLPSKLLLCIALIQKFGYNLPMIRYELDKQTNSSIDFTNFIIDYIEKSRLLSKSVFQFFYSFYKNIDFVYTFETKIGFSSVLTQGKVKKQKTSRRKDISKLFYEGFEIQI